MRDPMKRAIAGLQSLADRASIELQVHEVGPEERCSSYGDTDRCVVVSLGHRPPEESHGDLPSRCVQLSGPIYLHRSGHGRHGMRWTRQAERSGEPPTPGDHASMTVWSRQDPMVSSTYDVVEVIDWWYGLSEGDRAHWGYNPVDPAIALLDRVARELAAQYLTSPTP